MSTRAHRVLGGLLAVLTLVAPSAGDQIQDLIDQTSLGEYQSYLRVLTGVDPVPSNPPAYLTNRFALGPQAPIAGQWIRNEFESFGLNASVHSFPIGTEPQIYGQNIVGELLGTTRPNDIYVISSHYDTWSDVNPLIAPGADDNGSGTAAVLMAARILSQYQFEGTIRFITFSAEEQWMVGSDAYVSQAHNAGENIVADINLDMILHPGFDNLDPDPDYDVDIEANDSSLWLGQYLAAQFAAYTPLNFQVHNDPGQVSDHAAFWWYGYDAVGLSENIADEIWGGSNDTYHLPSDTIEHADYDWNFALHSVRGGMAGLAGLAELVPEPGTLGLMAVLGLLVTRGRRTTGRIAT